MSDRDFDTRPTGFPAAILFHQIRSRETQCDFTVTYHGSITLLTANTPEAEEWADAHLPADRTRWGGGSVVEPRYLEIITLAIQHAGLTLEIFQ
ncbi:hypothetical protein [Aliiruegeria lutimaris]|uniref:Uncharacterized protein n=1 Tax=Aliiruegeria lutimaris TaxID=571298 RepID=A0A1G9L7U1_9RHOB|nr:hypothetical protein [Aliiruegeria lutimaris]SDL57645.1 hypothetical protein SAMN04488026_10954 [Aliiruegeria lutimaris]